MPAKRKTRLKTPSDYNHKVHRFYADPWIADSLKSLSDLNKKDRKRDDTFSAVIIAGAMKTLRKNAARLRAAGVKLPEELFAK